MSSIATSTANGVTYTLGIRRGSFVIVDPTSTNYDKALPIVPEPETEAEAIECFRQFMASTIGSSTSTVGLTLTRGPQPGDAGESDTDLVIAIMGEGGIPGDDVVSNGDGTFTVKAGFLLSLMEEAGFGQEGN